MSVSEKSSIGYILKADLEYPDELHDSHNDYALVPENLPCLMKCCLIIVKKLQTNI